MANPNNAVGTNGAFGGRTSVNAFNDVLATFTGRGVIQGWAVTPSTGLKVNVGGQSGIRDVAIAEDNNGNRTTIDNISQAPIEITMPSAPSTGSRIDLIVGYVENPPQGSSTVIDNPAPTGIITVSGSSSSSPSAPTDSAIRTALTNAGINGATAYYAVLGSITIPSGTTDISSNMINATPYTNLNTQNNIATGQITADKVDFATIVGGIRSGLSANQTLNSTTSQNTVALSTTRYQWGVGFSQGANAILITAGINAIIASGQIYYFTNTANSKITQTIHLNSADIALINRHTGASNYQTYSFGTIMIPVSEGDVVSMTARNETTANCVIGANETNTWLQLIGLNIPNLNS